MKMAYIQKRFYKKTEKLIDDINGIIDEYKGLRLSVRQTFYQLVSRGIIPNKQEEYNKISELLGKARMAGLVDWDAIEDRTRYVREIQHWDNPQQIIRAAANSYAIDTRATQPCYIEAWIEKDALIGILEDTCSMLDVACFSCRGNPSITAIHDAAERCRNKSNPIILYAGDHDPSGLQIPRTIAERFEDFGVDVDIRRIGLTLEQIRQLNVPPNTAKETDPNYTAYVRDTGLTQSWELDALPPNELAGLFENAIHELTDFAELERMQEREKRDKTYFSEILRDGCD